MYFSRQRSRASALACLCAATGACAREAAPPVSRVVMSDDFGDTLVIGFAPQRIVSLNPTTTELLFAIGAGSKVVGRTSYDLYPKEVRAVPDLGQGLRPNVEAVMATRPDLVILYASADNRDAARRLRASGIATVAYKLDRIPDMARVTRSLGRLVGDTAAATRTIDSVQATLDRIRRQTAGLPHPRVFWHLWETPLLAVGGGSFLNDLLDIAGGQNVFAELPQPSPAITFEELVRRNPDVVLAGPTTRSRLMTDPRWKILRAVRENHVLVFDTTIVNGPSSRVGSSAASLARLIHPDVTF